MQKLSPLWHMRFRTSSSYWPAMRRRSRPVRRTSRRLSGTIRTGTGRKSRSTSNCSTRRSTRSRGSKRPSKCKVGSCSRSLWKCRHWQIPKPPWSPPFWSRWSRWGTRWRSSITVSRKMILIRWCLKTSINNFVIDSRPLSYRTKSHRFVGLKSKGNIRG